MSDEETGAADDELPWDFGLLSKAGEMRLRLQYGFNDLERLKRIQERQIAALKADNLDETEEQGRSEAEHAPNPTPSPEQDT